MKFLISTNQVNQKFSLIYRENDYSFDIEPYYDYGFASILVNDLQLEIDDNGRVLYVWGLCPLIEYEVTTESPQNYRSRTLAVALNTPPPIPGTAHRLNKNERWPVYVNKNQGWVCIGCPKIVDKQLIEFAPNCIAAMKGQEVMAIWLHPLNLPK